MAYTVSVPISIGELIDKITILEIKDHQIEDAGKLRNVRRELNALGLVLRDTGLDQRQAVIALKRQLLAVNQTLWKIEDDIRERERLQDFGPEFVALARSVYRTNDQRFLLKRQINEVAGSEYIEEKSYQSY